MKRTALRWIAAVSTIAAISALQGARRPRYGGELRIEMRDAPRTLDPAEFDPDAWLLSGAVFETLVKLDKRGDPEPWLATSWTHDTSRRCWVFTTRGNVVMHNGAVWPAKLVEISDAKSIEEILRELSRPKNAIVIHEPDGTLAGTGPFKIAKWEPGKSATLVAHDTYWGGRPYPDSIDVRMGREYAEQAADFQLGKADIVESQITAKKQNAPPNEVLALQFDARVSDAVREAVALSIDRTAIHRVILQRQGEPSAALLPQWLSGYAFLFSTERNVARARQMVASPASVTFSYDAKDPVLRAVAQRIEVDVREAGITSRVSPSLVSQGLSDMRLLRLPVTAGDPMIALEDMAAILKQPLIAGSPYDAERGLLNGNRVIPIVQLPKMWSLSPRVHGWPRLADVWLEP